MLNYKKDIEWITVFLIINFKCKYRNFELQMGKDFQGSLWRKQIIREKEGELPKQKNSTWWVFFGEMRCQEFFPLRDVDT